ncbi:hypothetical protein TVAG_372510 [Trichomonas vaginalis G3]|uniref:DUF3447 domain-containing protein n=1 Tax=Trichomonas vaginalis (strain ATCC PRA-98 / G3) TaxID=412133 RepID=A2EYZ4_TRIV3|nr:spectrin binding [Trichomonas vaginalis G3]EAY02106.1 hypothetical protein TVAG_372510 [Trichomonas vaginalis G3]KAI5532752.1 spectrin binding [Trichomonas vaginalis G3]|eukprot:XP_001314498.1 hypothetical protein [Trichomonas vaginalis G3]
MEIIYKIYEDYHPSFEYINPICIYFLNTVYNVEIPSKFIQESISFKDSNYILDVHEPSTVFRAIMDDNFEEFVKCSEKEDFQDNDIITNLMYPEEEMSLIELCTYYGSSNCFKLLRSKFQTKLTDSCLKYSFLGGSSEIINECLKYCTLSNECMDFAIISHNVDFISFLLQKQLTINLFNCSCFNNLQAFLIFFDNCDDLNYCFSFSSLFDIPSLCQFFIDKGCDIDAVDEMLQTALFKAASINAIEVAELLISNGADVNYQNEYQETPIFAAASRNHHEMVKYLISKGAAINVTNENGESAFHVAIRFNCEKVVEAFIENGFDPTTKFDDETPMEIAAATEAVDALKVLISHGADFNEVNEKGMNLLHTSAITGSENITKFLIKHGLDVNKLDIHGNSSLIYAIEGNHVDTAKILITSGADIHINNNNKDNLLHIAAKSDCIDMFKYLVTLGLNIDEKNADGKTPIDIAKENDFDDIISVRN